MRRNEQSLKIGVAGIAEVTHKGVIIITIEGDRLTFEQAPLTETDQDHTDGITADQTVEIGKTTIKGRVITRIGTDVIGLEVHLEIIDDRHGVGAHLGNGVSGFNKFINQR